MSTEKNTRSLCIPAPPYFSHIRFSHFYAKPITHTCERTLLVFCTMLATLKYLACLLSHPLTN